MPGGRPEPGRTRIDERERAVEVANAAGCLDAEPVADRLRASARRRARDAPRGPKPVDVFTKAAPAASARRHATRDLLLGQVSGLEDHLHERAATGRLATASHDRRDVVAHVRVVALQQRRR